jgi:hypothetical protein
VLGQMDGRATIREPAWRNGLPLFVMMDWAVRLIQDGACAITRPEYAAPRQPNGPVRQQNAATRQPNGPVRQQNAAVQWTQPDLSLLGRVLTKLRQLD